MWWRLQNPGLTLHKKRFFSIKDWVTFTEEILNRKLHFLCSDKKRYKIFLCQSNLNSLAPHGFAKVSALKAFNATVKYDFICFSEPYLDSTISSNDNNLCLDGYKLVRADHPKKIKQVRVCIYYRETIPVIVIQIN